MCIRDSSNLATRMVKFLSQRPSASRPASTAGTVTIGRASDSDIVVPDVLASREHATLVLTPLGTEIRDRSVNGTFVNGTRVGSAILTEGDVVTIGNVDLVFSNSTLLPRTAVSYTHLVLERRRTGQQMKSRCGQGVLVCPPVDVGTRQLFRCGVGNRAHGDIGFGDAADVAKVASYTEVRQQDATFALFGVCLLYTSRCV